MEFYDVNNNRIIIPDNVFDKEISHGECGTVYRYDDKTCFKCYNRKVTNTEFFLSTKIYNDLKRIENPHLIYIKDILYKKENTNKYVADGYLSSYYQEKYEDILEVSSDYLIYNIEEIIKLLNELSKYGIRVGYLKRNNLILTQNNIVLIDSDSWYYYKESKSTVKKLNINALASCFNEAVELSIQKNHSNLQQHNCFYTSYISNKLFPLTTNGNRTVKILSKRLNGYKRPIDYIYSDAKNKNLNV